MSDSATESPPSPDPKYSYVCWMDIMGTGNRMYQDISEVARKLLEFQTLAKDFESGELTIYPMMDGIYVVTEKVTKIIEFIDSIFEQAAEKVAHTGLEELFIIRGGLSYGPIVEGKDFSIEFNDEGYKQNIESLLIGPPMVEAYTIEENAPPFGIAVHESARAFTPDHFKFQWYQWFDSSNRELANDVRKSLESYFEFCKKHSHISNYPTEEVKKHEEMMGKYLPDVKLKNTNR